MQRQRSDFNPHFLSLTFETQHIAAMSYHLVFHFNPHFLSLTFET